MKKSKHPLTDNLCWCLESKNLHYPIVHVYNDYPNKIAAPYLELLANNGSIRISKGSTWQEFNIKMALVVPMPPDCDYIVCEPKDRFAMTEDFSNEYLSQLIDIAFCMSGFGAPSLNPYTANYCERTGQKPHRFKFPDNYNGFDWKQNTDKAGADENKNWRVSIEFKLWGDLETCRKCGITTK